MTNYFHITSLGKMTLYPINLTSQKFCFAFHFTYLLGFVFQGHPVLESEDKCIIHISWATVAACPNIQKVDLENCRVFDNGTGQVYSLKPRLNSPGSHHFTVV